MKIVSFFLVVFGVIFSLCSCEKLEELTVVKIPVSSSYSIEIEDIKVNASNEGLNTFDGAEFVGVSSIEGMRENERQYISHITKIKAGSGSITITSNDGSGSVVKDFVLKADGFGSDFSISQCAFGEPYTEGVADYLNGLMAKLISDGDRNIRVSGKTDASAGKTLTVKITLDEIVIYAKVID